jgi:hypothetical protein
LTNIGASLALVAGIVASLSHPLIECVSDLLIGLGCRALVDHRGPHTDQDTAQVAGTEITLTTM